MAWRITPQARTAMKRKEATTALHPFAVLPPKSVSKGILKNSWGTSKALCKFLIIPSNVLDHWAESSWSSSWSFPAVDAKGKKQGDTTRCSSIMLSIWRYPCDISGLAQTIYRWRKELKTGMPTAMPISHDLLSLACSISTACSAQPRKALLASGTSIHSSHCHEQGNTDKAHPHGAICSSEPYLDRQIYIAIDIYRDRDIKSSAFLKVLTAPFCHCLQTTTSALSESHMCSDLPTSNLHDPEYALHLHLYGTLL